MRQDQQYFDQVKAANLMPINQAAATVLRQTEERPVDWEPHILSLMCWAVEKGLGIPGEPEMNYWLHQLAERRGPAGFADLATGEQDGGNLDINQFLQQETPMDAAELLMDNLVSNYKAGL